MLWDEFANSLHHNWRGDGAAKDELDAPEWPLAWAKKRGLPAPGMPNDTEMTGLKRLRDLIRRAASACSAEEPIAPEDVKELNSHLLGGSYVRRLEHADGGFSVLTEPVETSWRQVSSQIALSLAETLAEGEPRRFRICDNENCRWVYYDDTRNRSKRYCEDKTCGNLMKVRRFRARKKAESEDHGHA